MAITVNLYKGWVGKNPISSGWKFGRRISSFARSIVKQKPVPIEFDDNEVSYEDLRSEIYETFSLAKKDCVLYVYRYDKTSNNKNEIFDSKLKNNDDSKTLEVDLYAVFIDRKKEQRKHYKITFGDKTLKYKLSKNMTLKEFSDFAFKQYNLLNSSQKIDKEEMVFILDSKTNLPEKIFMHEEQIIRLYNQMQDKNLLSKYQQKSNIEVRKLVSKK